MIKVCLQTLSSSIFIFEILSTWISKNRFLSQQLPKPKKTSPTKPERSNLYATNSRNGRPINMTMINKKALLRSQWNCEFLSVESMSQYKRCAPTTWKLETVMQGIMSNQWGGRKCRVRSGKVYGKKKNREVTRTIIGSAIAGTFRDAAVNSIDVVKRPICFLASRRARVHSRQMLGPFYTRD